jgi:hypothetical protein
MAPSSKIWRTFIPIQRRGKVTRLAILEPAVTDVLAQEEGHNYVSVSTPLIPLHLCYPFGPSCAPLLNIFV